MKKFLFITSIVFLLSSCAVKYPYRQYSAVVDFTEYTNQGFFITESNSVSFDYDPIGSVSSVVKSGYEVLGQEMSAKGNMKDDVYYHENTGKLKFGKYISANIEDALSELVNASKELGANGIINLEVNYISATYDKYGDVASPSSYIVSGMAIKSL